MVKCLTKFDYGVNPMKTVLTGATGHLGQQIIRHLAYRTEPSNLIVSVRRPESVQSLVQQGIEARYGDYDDPSSLRASFQGASKLMFISSPHQDDTVRLRQHQAVIKAASEAGVGHIVYTSIAYPEEGKLPLHRLHLLTEQTIAESRIPYTFLRNCYYMDIILFLGIREAAASGVLLSPPGDWRFNTASREDLAAAAAVVLTEQGHENRCYELTAAREWGLKELARALTEASGRQVVHRTDPALKNPVYEMLPYSQMKRTSSDLERLIGRTPGTVRDEVRRIFMGE